MVVHVNLGADHILQHSGFINVPWHDLHGEKFYREMTTTVKTGKCKTVFYLHTEIDKPFKTLKAFIKHYGLEI